MQATLLAVLAGAGFALAAVLGIAGRGITPQLRAMAMTSAAGILLSIAVVELIPAGMHEAGAERAAIAFLAGFVLLYGVEVATKGHTHHAPDTGAEHVHAHAHVMAPFVTGLALHNLVDGATIAASTELSVAAASGVVAGVLVHQVPVGVSCAVVIAATGAPRPRATRIALLLAACIPLGAAMVSLLGLSSDAAVALLVAGAGGALVYIAAGHLLPAAHAERLASSAALAFPIAMAVTTGLLVALPHQA